jgi:uroporphyrinogen III methyltransferase/synthase
VVVADQSPVGDLKGELLALGADVIELRTTRIEPPSDLRAFAELVQDAYCYDWIVFTSPDGVAAFFDLFYKIYEDAREIGGARIAAIGLATAERIKQFHLKVDLQADAGESMAEAIDKDGSVENLRILLVRAETARDLLPRKLSALGAIVDEGFAYRAVSETRDDGGAKRRFLEEGAHLITFTSSPTVEQFLTLNLPLPGEIQIASIGPSTSATIRDRGLKVAVEARRQDVVGLVKAIREFLLPQRKN